MSTQTTEPTPLVKHEPEHVLHASETFTPKRTIVMPVDESAFSKYSVTWAIDNLINKDTDLVVLLNVRPYTSAELSRAMGTAAMSYITNTEVIKKQEEFATKQEQFAKNHSHKLLIESAKPFQEKNIHVRAISLRGDVRDCLDQKIEVLKPTFVVMGNRGLGLVSRALMGSVSQHLVNTCKYPVLIVPKA